MSSGLDVIIHFSYTMDFWRTPLNILVGGCGGVVAHYFQWNIQSNNNNKTPVITYFTINNKYDEKNHLAFHLNFLVEFFISCRRTLIRKQKLKKNEATVTNFRMCITELMRTLSFAVLIISELSVLNFKMLLKQVWIIQWNFCESFANITIRQLGVSFKL